MRQRAAGAGCRPSRTADRRPAAQAVRSDGPPRGDDPKPGRHRTFARKKDTVTVDCAGRPKAMDRRDQTDPLDAPLSLPGSIRKLALVFSSAIRPLPDAFRSRGRRRPVSGADAIGLAARTIA